MTRPIKSSYFNPRPDPPPSSPESKELSAMGTISGLMADPNVPLDTLLVQCADETRSLTGASGVVVAISNGKVISCRATSGQNVPSVGTPVDTSSGVAGECVRTGQTVRCDNAEEDPRVNNEGARALGIRSIVAVPIFENGKLSAIIEAFSATTGGFGQADEATLERVSRLIGSALARAKTRDTSSSWLDEAGPEQEMREREERGERIRARLRRLGIATVLVVLVGVLGWAARVTIYSARRQPPEAAASPAQGRPQAEALNSLAQAAEQGDPEAQFQLGSLYLRADSTGTQHSDVEAAEWFAKAAEQGQVGAQSMLGSLYFTGRGVPRDYLKAYMWSSIAAAQGNPVSQEQLAEVAPYMSSDDLAESKRQSAAWLQKHGKAPQVTPQHVGAKR